MQLFIERPQPEQAPQTKPTRSRGISAPSLRQFGTRLTLAAILVGVGVGLRPSPSQAAVELYQGPGQSDASMINPCGPLTKVSELCFDDRLNPDGTSKEPEQQGVYRRLLRAGHPEDIDIPFYRAVCPDGAFPGTENPQICVDQVSQVPVEGATMATITEERFASALAVPTEQPVAEPTPAPSPEPVAQPAEVDPFSLPTGVVFQEPFAPGKRWLGNVDSCIRDAQHYNPSTYKCISSQTVFSPGNPVVITSRREGTLPAEAKQGPGDRIITKTFRVLPEGRQQIRHYETSEILRFDSGDVFYGPPAEIFSRGVYEFSSNVNNGPDQFVYRIQYK